MDLTIRPLPPMPFPPRPTSLPLIVGAAEVGVELTAENATWENGVDDLALQWYRCTSGGVIEAAVDGANKLTYTPTVDDIGHALRLRIEAANQAGIGIATSAPSNVIAIP